MKRSVAIVGAGVSGLTCGVVLAERGFRISIFAKEIGQQTTSAAAAAIWYPYDVEPADKAIPWALETYNVLIDLGRKPRAGVSMIELQQFSRAAKIQIPDWAIPLGAEAVIPSEAEGSLELFKSGFSLRVPLMDTTIYLDYLAARFLGSGGTISANVWFEKLEAVDRKFDLVINCTGMGARDLVHDIDLEPHRGQVVIVPKVAGLSHAVACDDAPLMYAIPRTNDCVFGGTNEITADLGIDPASTLRILKECSRVLKIDKPNVLAERVGLRPFRRSGLRLEPGSLGDGRRVIHNYGHGGAGFTLSWGCAGEVADLAMS